MKVRCCIRNCRRHHRERRPKADDFWICARHWRLVPPEIRAAHKLAKRAWRRRSRAWKDGRWTYRSATAERRSGIAIWSEAVSAWLACVREATIADAMGLR